MLVLLLAAACAEPLFPSDEELVQIRSLQALHTVPADLTNKYTDKPAAVALGKALFEEVGLSRCGTIGCITCHAPPLYSDRQEFSQGCGAVTTRNTPTLLNVGFRRWLYWDGRKDTIWAHGVLPITRDIEMNQDVPGLRAFFASAKGAPYVAPYASLFGGAIADEQDDRRLLSNLTKALAAYLRTLVAVDSPFDKDLPRFLEAVAQDQEEKDPMWLPLKTFVRTGRCIACHKGPNFSDDSFHNLGLDDHATHDRGHLDGVDVLRMDPYNGAGTYSDSPAIGKAKLDALSVTEAADLGAFKTPSLRNVELTEPYMHTGKLAKLDDVINFYDKGGDAPGTFEGTRTSTIIPLKLKAEEKAALKTFLQSLTATSLKP